MLNFYFHVLQFKTRVMLEIPLAGVSKSQSNSAAFLNRGDILRPSEIWETSFQHSISAVAPFTIRIRLRLLFFFESLLLHFQVTAPALIYGY